MIPLRIAFYGDDFTGSTDAMEFLTRAGVKTVLFISPPTTGELSRYPDLQAVGVAGMTRSMSPQAMEAELTPAFSTLRALGARHVHYKVCSTFDSSPTVGSIGKAIDVGAGIFGSRFVPLLVGAPRLGRYCVFGNLFARMGIGTDGEIHRLDRHLSMSRHPVTPADESDLRRHLSRQTAKQISLFDILHLELSDEPQAMAHLNRMLEQDQSQIVLFDILFDRQLERIGRMLDSLATKGDQLFSVGSSAIEMALGAHWASAGELKPVQSWPEARSSGPVLVASGSCSPTTSTQIDWALAHGFAEVGLDAPAIAESAGRSDRLDSATADAVRHIKSGRSAIFHTSRGPGDARIAAATAAFARAGNSPTASAEIFGAALGLAARRIVEQTKVRRLVIAGGDTSSYAARALGIRSLEMIAPIWPGAPLCRADAPGSPIDGLEVNFKGGQVGGEDFFGLVAGGRV